MANTKAEQPESIPMIMIRLRSLDGWNPQRELRYIVVYSSRFGRERERERRIKKPASHPHTFTNKKRRREREREREREKRNG